MKLVIYAEQWKAMIVNAEQERKPSWVAMFIERDGYDHGATMECLRHARNLQLERYIELGMSKSQVAMTSLHLPLWSQRSKAMKQVMSLAIVTYIHEHLLCIN